VGPGVLKAVNPGVSWVAIEAAQLTELKGGGSHIVPDADGRACQTL
jgi:hypothetical protein